MNLVQLWGLFLTAFLVALSGALMPGPLLSATIAESARRGWKAGPQIMLGHGVLELVLLIGLMAGLSSILQKPEATRAIALLGGLFLLYLGFSMARQAVAGRIELEAASSQAPAAGLNPVLAGILVSLSNPYWSIWWATIGLGYLTLAMEQGIIGLAVFFSGHILADLAWYMLVAVLVAGGRRFLSQRIYNYILVACGVFLVAMGIFFIYRVIV